MDKCNYVNIKDVKKYRKEIVSIILIVIQDIKIKYKKGVNFQIVGSAKKNLVVRKGNSDWDIDFQLVLNSKCFNDLDPWKIKEQIFNFFKKRCGEEYTLNMSTSVIEIRVKQKKEWCLSSFDIAIIREIPQKKQVDILRGKVGDKSSINACKWENVSDQEYYSKRKDIINWVEFRRIFLKKKCENYDKGKDKKETFSLYLESIKETIDIQ